MGSRRALWLLWGRLKELDRFCGSSTGSMVAVGEAKGARSFLWELDGDYGVCGGGSRSSIVCGALMGSVDAESSLPAVARAVMMNGELPDSQSGR